jgi:hypothetical protein
VPRKKWEMGHAMCDSDVCMERVCVLLTAGWLGGRGDVVVVTP